MSKASDLDVSSLSPNDIPDAVDVVLADYIQSRKDALDAIGEPVSKALGHLEDFILGGGKRIRPVFGWAGFLGADGFAGEEEPHAVLRAVSALEFIQTCALVHDDIIDKSDTRRGRPTVHKAVAAHHEQNAWSGDADHFGVSVAILIGDLALAWADDMVFDSGLSDAALRRSREPWRSMRSEVIGGQMLDIALEAMASEDGRLSRSVNRYKTAAYTIERPLHLGAALAGAPQQIIDGFRGYGHDIGIAFQLRDDLLGVFGDPAATGKGVYDDLREGKRTELLALALRRSDEHSPAAAETLRRSIGVVDTHEELAQLAEIIESSGAVEEMERRIEKLTDSGIAHLHDAGVPQDVIDTLIGLAHQATRRRS
ncbi:geranylgeranyl pyrophosphate synthase [Corynebacterium yudongzhengii]|uniref:Polyprenyl synthetase family protein n=1 Tax=Corynebacterium yudongzhengii TaxID=2080740 RepID=A0A2U1T791_9CORY|nr:polyprenyl synthetase family protein [Corynebacterium yudongzhengii]AWB81559.1 geranylgeranyl pyrophosphate synthase [Corynebacterium yudongzhengii]PWC01870.1 polyprenyl synthetase family protein [Corynebacterium yudongzhengii]